jgi:uncharacterized protein (TIGR02246 family)
MMADTPQAVLREYEAAEAAGDYDALADLYEVDAIMAVEAVGKVARGRDEIRAMLELAGQRQQLLGLEVKHHPMKIIGDYSFGTLLLDARFRVRRTGQEIVAPIQYKEVLHRGEDGKWRYLVDVSSLVE